ncbi:hypothetical protein CERSUDRAFT_104200 [Gelatoporia subvermispora B]|uniref:CCZ1/INTU/HSP4 first Longin domain-containing protein n=1 Tax=Ceriporiopsis subvermispora (strain B) TaxID=914234 RepID=M2QPD5_CERS8|nr:hypothetical protein CERSUDRAFT_104200 [Gelatoporia subvermispora B]
MSRVPAGLAYLTIYNPTLRPIHSSSDEDAEEQAHILFYTAKERAVSRDRMLRQVGLAKALVNFSQMFNVEDSCENVHSQSRRMIMVSPEPNYWIHASIDLAKTPRPATVRAKGKGKDKPGAPKADNVSYDYHDASVHDDAIRERLLQGYEQFKLVHGSFESILNTFGHEALELQLERFWTVWAWRWDIEQDCQFASILGAPLHPLSRAATPCLDEFASTLSDELCVFALQRPYLIPSTKFSSARYPRALTQHIASRIPPPPPPGFDGDQALDQDGAGSDRDKPPEPSRAVSPSTFLAMPSMNLGVGMDMRGLKWGWPGYLTFGKGSRPASLPTSPAEAPVRLPSMSPEQKADEHEAQVDDDAGAAGARADVKLRKLEVDVDTESLLEAISSVNAHTPSPREGSPVSTAPTKDTPELGIQSKRTHPSQAVHTGEGDPPADNASLQSQQDASDAADNDAEGTTRPSSPETPQQSASTNTIFPDTLPPFLSARVHLPDLTSAGQMQRRRVWHLTKETITIALIAQDDEAAEPPCRVEQVADLISAVRDALAESQNKEINLSRGAEAAIPTATKILQPQDKHVISKGEYTMSNNAGFSCNSEHLFYGKQMLESDSDVLEVFSRGQNPQYWHVAKRGLGVDSDGHAIEGRVFLEVARKESSLPDVDNELATRVRKYIDERSG